MKNFKFVLVLVFISQFALAGHILVNLNQPFPEEKECDLKWSFYKDQMKKAFPSDEKFEVKGNCAKLKESFVMVFDIQSSNLKAKPTLVYETLEVINEKAVKTFLLASASVKRKEIVVKTVNGKYALVEVEANATEKKLEAVQKTVGTIQEAVENVAPSNYLFHQLNAVKDKIYLIDSYFSKDKKSLSVVGFVFLSN